MSAPNRLPALKIFGCRSMSFFGFGILTSEGNISAPLAEALLSLVVPTVKIEFYLICARLTVTSIKVQRVLWRGLQCGSSWLFLRHC
jgi:hypothetical protein